MSVAGTARVTCPACGRAQDAALVQSIHTRSEPEAKRKLLAGELNVLACACGARTQLAATVLFRDPDADYTAQVVIGDADDIARAVARFEVAGMTGTWRVVPSLNALIEKVKLLDAGLEDWAIEMTKVLLLATLDPLALERVMLFDRVDREEQRIHWVRFDGRGVPAAGSAAEWRRGSIDGRGVPAASPLAAYDKLRARASVRPSRTEVLIDRAWAVAAVQTMIANAQGN